MEMVVMFSCFSLAKIWRQCPRLHMIGWLSVLTTLTTKQWTIQQLVCENGQMNERKVQWGISLVHSCYRVVPSNWFITTLSYSFDILSSRAPLHLTPTGLKKLLFTAVTQGPASIPDQLAPAAATQSLPANLPIWGTPSKLSLSCYPCKR